MSTQPMATQPVRLCPVCQNSEGEPWTTGQDYEIWTCQDPWSLRHCSSCQHLWLHPRPAESELSVIYPPTYYAYSYEEKVSLVARKAKEFLDARKLQPILKLLGREPRSFLDIGCGSGRYLRMMRARGVDPSRICGLELDEEKTERLRREGFQAYSQRVEDCEELETERFDLVTMFHVLEHVDDPGAVLRKIHRSLSAEGLLVVETPNFHSLDARLFRHRYWGGYHFPRHWNLFSPSSLHTLLSTSGFELVDLRYQTGHAFWMWSLHHLFTHQWRSPRLGKLFHPIEGFLPCLAAFTGFDLLRSRLGQQTSAMLLVARKDSSESLHPTP